MGKTVDGNFSYYIFHRVWSDAGNYFQKLQQFWTLSREGAALLVSVFKNMLCRCKKKTARHEDLEVTVLFISAGEEAGNVASLSGLT